MPDRGVRPYAGSLVTRMVEARAGSARRGSRQGRAAPLCVDRLGSLCYSSRGQRRAPCWGTASRSSMFAQAQSELQKAQLPQTMNRQNLLSILGLVAFMVTRTLALPGNLILCVAPGGHVALERGPVTCEGLLPSGTPSPGGLNLASAPCAECTDIPLLADGGALTTQREHPRAPISAPFAATSSTWISVLHSPSTRTSRALPLDYQTTASLPMTVILRC
jgi:hypothetical protein